MNNKFYIIAGNHSQFLEFAKKKAQEMYNDGYTWVTLSNFVNVTVPTQLKGISNPHGWFVGTWKHNSNIRDILFEFKYCIYEHGIPDGIIQASNELNHYETQ